MRRHDAGSAGVSPAMNAKRENSHAPDGAFADGTSALPVIADLLEYPDADWQSKGVGCPNDRLFAEFRQRVEPISLSLLQELYTRTFDLNPVCALEIGYHLFGENYKRGEFLANLRETEAPFDLGQQQQLPDYLPVLLRLLTKLKEKELRSSLISECLIPAIDKMLTALKESDNPYRFLLEALQATLQAEAPTVSHDAPRSMRASLPVLNNDRDLLSGSATGCAVLAPPHRPAPFQINWSDAPGFRGIAQDPKAIAPKGQRPSAPQAAEPHGEFVSR